MAGKWEKMSFLMFPRLVQKTSLIQVILSELKKHWPDFFLANKNSPEAKAVKSGGGTESRSVCFTDGCGEFMWAQNEIQKLIWRLSTTRKCLPFGNNRMLYRKYFNIEMLSPHSLAECLLQALIQMTFWSVSCRSIGITQKLMLCFKVLSFRFGIFKACKIVVVCAKRDFDVVRVFPRSREHCLFTCGFLTSSQV